MWLRDNGRKTISESVPIFEMTQPNQVTGPPIGAYDLALGVIEPATLRSAASTKRSVSMARLPRSEPLFSDDSWGLFLVPVVTCIGLFISAIFWL